MYIFFSFSFVKKDNPYAASLITKKKEQEVYVSKREPPFEKVRSFSYIFLVSAWRVYIYITMCWDINKHKQFLYKHMLGYKTSTSNFIHSTKLLSNWSGKPWGAFQVTNCHITSHFFSFKKSRPSVLGVNDYKWCWTSSVICYTSYLGTFWCGYMLIVLKISLFMKKKKNKKLKIWYPQTLRATGQAICASKTWHWKMRAFTSVLQRLLLQRLPFPHHSSFMDHLDLPVSKNSLNIL